MKLTPLDIRHKEFTRAMRGYKDIEVDEFLDQIVEEFERLFNENIDYRDRLEAIEGKVEQYQNIEETLKKTLVSAQQQAEELKQNSQKEADLILRDAELKSRSIINDSYAERQKVQRSVQALKQKYEDLRYQIKKVIESYMNIIDQDEAADELEQIDEMIEDTRAEQPPVAVTEKPLAAPVSVEEGIATDTAMAESAETGPGYGDRVADIVDPEPDFGDKADVVEAPDETVSIDQDDPSRIELPANNVVEDNTVIDDDPFADLDTDSDDQQFKW